MEGFTLPLNSPRSARSFIEAMGGQLEIKAIFPDGAVRISQFEKLGESPQA